MANHPARGRSAALSTPSQPWLAAPSTTSRNKHWTYSKPPQPRTPQRSHLPQHHPHPTTPRPPRRRAATFQLLRTQLADIDATPTPQTVALAHNPGTRLHRIDKTRNPGLALPSPASRLRGLAATNEILDRRRMYRSDAPIGMCRSAGRDLPPQGPKSDRSSKRRHRVHRGVPQQSRPDQAGSVATGCCSATAHEEPVPQYW
jgi:hypothetical protein